MDEGTAAPTGQKSYGAITLWDLDFHQTGRPSAPFAQQDYNSTATRRRIVD